MQRLLSALFLLLASQVPAFSQHPFPVRFAHGTEIFPENFASYRQTYKVSADELVNGHYARYIQLEKIMNASERAAFEATGARVVGYIQFGAYLVLLPQDFDFQQIEAFSPRSILPVKPEWKMANSLRKLPYGAWAVHGDFIDVNLQLYPSIGIAEGAARCRKAGLDVLKEGTQNGLLQVRIHKNQVIEVAAMPYIQYLELAPPPSEKDDTHGRALHRSNLIDSDAPMGKKYNGEGVVTLVRDDGSIGPHIDFSGRLDNLDALPDLGNHGDLVAGCVGAAGNLDPTAKGMASGAYIYVIDYVPDFQDQTMGLVQSKGITITNTSYTDGFNAGYTINAQTVDQQLYNNPNLTHVFSAGNANDDNVDYGYGAGTQWGNITGGHKMAKNGFVVGNIDANGTINFASSRGPATDGRLKPDISAFGEDIYMTQPNNTYTFNTGTSFSAPNITGCLAQLTQAFRTIYGVSDAPSALLKSTMLNTATDLGNIGPDFKFGWGQVNAWRALHLLEQNQWLEGSTDQNGDATHTLQIPAGVREAKVMIYWAEPPAAENSAKTLINDLDLTVNDANGTVFLPWKLDPTPNPVNLDTPAGKGRDSLNNAEQVLIENPAAGAYTIHIKGTEVPLGPQHYYIVWEFVTDEIKVTYPAGGEGFAPGEVEQLHWDAYDNTGLFTLQYSTDGGATFLPITNIGGDQRVYHWTVPNTVSGKVHVLVARGAQRDTSDFPSSIVPVPKNLQVTRVCPYSITLNWTAVNDTLSYDGYLLGNKYMELKGSTDSNSVTMPIQNGELEQWLSVRSSHPDGTAGRRAIALHWPGGALLNCPQSYDLAVREVLAPAGDAIVSCDASDQTITIRVINEGQNVASGGTAFYQVGASPAVSEALPDIPAGTSLEFSFQTPLVINTNGNITLKTWVLLSGDIVRYNDTLARSYGVLSEGINQFFNENFEQAPGFPAGWASVNPDAEVGWETTDDLLFQVVGPDNLLGRSVQCNFYEYGPDFLGREDYLYMVPINLAGMNNPALTFEVAHARYDNSYSDGMRVEVFTNCDLNASPDTIWAKKDPELATVPNQTSFYYAESAADWRSETVDLSPYAGQKILLRFVSINGYGNTLYLDHIGITGFDPPIAEFEAPDTICRLDTVVFQAIPSTSDATYTWSFGSAAIPNAATGIGPHSVSYPTVGNKLVRLIVSNNIGLDTTLKPLAVIQPATANFTSVQNGLMVTFTNTSTGATSYLWDFGDGVTSTAVNPSHTYAGPDNYVVKLFATNACSTQLKTMNLGVTGVNELTESIAIRILPNPTAGDFEVELNSRNTGKIQLSLFDAAGRQVIARETTTLQGITRVAFENLNLPKGLYQLNIQAEGKQATFSIAVQ